MNYHIRMYGGVTLLAYFIMHTHLRGKEAREIYNRDNSKEANGTDNCDEEQIQQTRSRTALKKRLIYKFIIKNKLSYSYLFVFKYTLS